MSPPRILPLVVLLAACQAQSVPERNPVANAPAVPSAQWSGQYGGREEFAVIALRNPAEWDRFWTQVSRAKPQSLDVPRQMAVAVFLGQRRTGGYSVEIAGVRNDGTKLLVEFRETTPPPDMMVTQALTTPWAVAIVPRSDLPLEPRKLGASSARREK